MIPKLLLNGSYTSPWFSQDSGILHGSRISSMVPKCIWLPRKELNELNLLFRSFNVVTSCLFVPKNFFCNFVYFFKKL